MLCTHYLFTLQVRDYLVKKADLKMPAAFLKRWLYTINEGKFSMEDIEKEFPAFLRMMKWNLVQKKLADRFGIKVEQDEMLEEAKAYAAAQFAQYGIGAGELSFAAVHDNQVGQFGSFGDQAAVTAEDDLAHRDPMSLRARRGKR